MALDARHHGARVGRASLGTRPGGGSVEKVASYACIHHREWFVRPVGEKVDELARKFLCVRNTTMQGALASVMGKPAGNWGKPNIQYALLGKDIRVGVFESCRLTAIVAVEAIARVVPFPPLYEPEYLQITFRCLANMAKTSDICTVSNSRPLSS